MSQSPVDRDAEEQLSAYSDGWRQMTRKIENGGSWSGRERHCCFLNTGTSGFADVSAITGLDFPDDGRAVAVTDWDHDGDLDVWLTSRTSPRLRFMRNNATKGARFLNVQLKGRRCNRDAIGARVELHLGGPSPRTLIRTVRAGEAFLSQSSRWVHFGLGDQPEIEKLVVYWPGSDGVADRTSQTFSGLDADKWYRIAQGDGAAEEWSPPVREIRLEPGPLQTPDGDDLERIVLSERVPLPNLPFSDSEGRTQSFANDTSGPVLINLWATWCAPCIEELQGFSARQEELKAAGVQIAAYCVDGLADGGQAAGDQAAGDQAGTSAPRQLPERLRFPFHKGFAAREMLDKLDVMHDVTVSLRAMQDETLSLPVPTSFLIDREHRLSVIYRGPVPVEQLLADVAALDSRGEPLATVPFAGRWFLRPGGTSTLFARFADRFGRRGYLEEADQFASLAADLASREGSLYEVTGQLVSVFAKLGDVSRQQGHAEDTIRHYRRAIGLSPNRADLQHELGRVLASQSRIDESIEHLSNAVRLDPNNDEARKDLNTVRAQLNR